MSSSRRTPEWNDAHIVIIGAGFGGIVAGLTLKNHFGFTNFTIIERSSEIGGAWRDNTYPGCSVDIPGLWYSIASAPNPAWSVTYAHQPEIFEYQKDVVRRNGLYPHIQFNSNLIGAEWVEEKQGYKLLIQRTASTTAHSGIAVGPGAPHTPDLRDSPPMTPVVEEIFAQFLITATGGSWAVPKVPYINGMETFKGETWHTARWRWDIDLKHKRVGIIGNGASACQIVPELAKEPSTHIVNFCRAPQWFAKRHQLKIGAFWHWLYRTAPFTQTVARYLLFIMWETYYTMFPRATAWIRKLIEWDVKRYIRAHSPKEQHEHLIPDYPLGCRRIIRDPDYLESLRKPNVQLEWDTIDRIVPDGIILKTGKHIPLDYIVAATGFETTSSIALPIRGRGGLELEGWWNAQGGPTAYKGTTMPNFPNLILLNGPNAGSPYSSLIFYMECQMKYVCQLIKPLLTKGSNIASFEVRQDATDAYNTKVQKGIANGVWTAAATYYNQYGGKNVVIYPWAVTRWWWELLWPTRKDYNFFRRGSSTPIV